VAHRPPTIAFADVSLDQPRRMSRRPRMDLELYHALKMKHRILRIAAELSILVMVRKVPRSLMLWHSTDKARLQAIAVAVRLQSPRQPPHTTRQGRRRMGSAVRQRPALGDRGR
jgi:hypothetical protein